MESVPRNVILDLLPAYIAGEASEESRALVEEYARHDPQIARLIRAGALEPAATTPKVAAPDDLEMKALKRVRRTIRRQIAYVGIATALLLMIPLVAMQFSDEVNWTGGDFVFAGTLLFGTGVTFVLIARQMDNLAYRAAVAVGVLAGLGVIWVNGAVGIIGSENNPANLLFFAVHAVAIIGIFTARFRARGMMRAMFATAATQALIPVIALLAFRPAIDPVESSLPQGLLIAFGANMFFVMLWAVSALLFRWASERDARPHQPPTFA